MNSSSLSALSLCLSKQRAVKHAAVTTTPSHGAWLCVCRLQLLAGLTHPLLLFNYPLLSFLNSLLLNWAVLFFIRIFIIMSKLISFLWYNVSISIIKINNKISDHHSDKKQCGKCPRIGCASLNDHYIIIILSFFCMFLALCDW